MRTSLILAAGLLGLCFHCSSGTGQSGLTTADLDGGAGTDAAAADATPQTFPGCAEQAPQVSSANCAVNESLYICGAEAPAPADPCKRAAIADGYCCPKPPPKASLYLMVCRNLTVTDMASTLRFHVTPKIDGGAAHFSLRPLKATARKLAQSETVGETAELLDADKSVESFRSTTEDLVVPLAANPAGKTIFF